MRITANQVTFARLVAMPALCGVLYGDKTSLVVGVILGTLIGCTDFVDGYLARKQGPTVLGGLMDPIADKVFIVVTYVPFADRGWVPWWPVLLIFLREFLVTALRSSFELRQRHLKSTYLAKVKTWVQMCGLGVLALLMVASKTVLLALFGGGAAAAVVALVVFKLVTGRIWRGSWVFALGFGVLTAVLAWGGPARAHEAMIWVVVGITWLSALDYVVVGAREVLSTLKGFDLARLAGAGVLTVVALVALRRADAPAWAIVTVLAIEIAHAGLDNLLAHHGAAASAGAWAGRLGLIVGAFAGAMAAPAHGTWLSIVALAAATAGAVVTFWQKRRYYLEETLREKKRVAAGQVA